TEFVRQIAGVDFIEDSKGTNVGATLAALRGLGQTVVLIAGGLGKGQDFSPLAPVVREHARAVVLIGQDGPAIQQALADTGVPLVSCATLQQAVTVAMAHAVPGDAVLLSPACASMDMFRNYGHRAACFIEAVHDLAADRGEVA
ncbi:MAG TPA: cyanophycin synthetase, partial [Castellaniella sp.]|nr:cyanophycin synthetase [Castellaniella sp.]